VSRIGRRKRSRGREKDIGRVVMVVTRLLFVLGERIVPLKRKSRVKEDFQEVQEVEADTSQSIEASSVRWLCLSSNKVTRALALDWIATISSSAVSCPLVSQGEHNSGPRIDRVRRSLGTVPNISDA
jgi:hypothetical protein